MSREQVNPSQPEKSPAAAEIERLYKNAKTQVRFAKSAFDQNDKVGVIARTKRAQGYVDAILTKYHEKNGMPTDCTVTLDDVEMLQEDIQDFKGRAEVMGKKYNQEGPITE